MSDADPDRILELHLELQLGSRPLRGQLRNSEGAAEEFVGWLGFVEALRALSERHEKIH